jgi:hypothetical protein
MIKKNYLPVTIVLLLSVVLLLAAACGGSDSDDDSATNTPDATDIAAGTPAPETVEPGATSVDGDETPGNGDEPTADLDPTEEAVAETTARDVRELERSAQKLNSLSRILSSRVGQAGPSLLGTPSEDNDNNEERWFDDCCENIAGDLAEELDSMKFLLPGLSEIYEGAGDQERQAAVDDIATSIANIEASLAVMESLPTSEGAADIVEDISTELQNLTEAIATLQ